MSVVVLAQRSAPSRGRLARIFGASPLTAESRAAYEGAIGELVVGDVLENLGPAWDVLHDLPLGITVHQDSILDHLVIGPAGVFAVHVVNYTDKDVVVAGDTLLVEGETLSHIQCAKTQSDAAALLLGAAAGSPVRVRPLLVVVNPRRFGVRAAATGVRVIPSHQLDRLLSRSPRTLHGDEVARISDLADLAETWPDAPPMPLDVVNLHQEFAVIRGEVRRALLRRALWVASGIAVLYVTVWTLIASFVSLLIAAR